MLITSGFTYVAFLVFFAGLLVWCQKATNWKIFDFVPPIVMVYLFNMLFCTVGLWDMKATAPAYSAVKNNLLYGMIFVMLLRCDIRKMVKIGPRMLAIFFCCAFTIMAGFVVAYVMFKGKIGAESWRAMGALCASWIGGSANMAALQGALNVPEGDYACALIVDTIYYSVWIALLLMAVPLEKAWNRFCNARTVTFEEAEDAQKAAAEGTAKMSGATLTILLGLSLMVSALSQAAGKYAAGLMPGMLKDVFNASTCTMLIVTALGLVAALSPIGRIAGADALSTMYLYAVISLLASRAGLNELLDAPMWLMAGLFVFIVHIVAMVIFSKLFHFDLCMVSTASLANIGGAASAPIVAAAYNPGYTAIGVVMGVIGAAAGNILGFAAAYLMKMFA